MIMLNLIFLILIFIFLLYILNKLKIKNKDILKIVFIVLALEIFVFNINSYRLKFKNYEEKNYSNKDEFIIQDLKYDKQNNIFIIDGDNPNIQLENINTEIGTIKINAELINNNRMEYNLSYTDETSKNYRELPHKTLVKDMDRSKYTTCYLSGVTNKLKVSFRGEQGTEIMIDSIDVNSDIPFNINIIRVFTLSAIIIFIYKIITGKTFNLTYSDKNKKQVNIIYIIIMIFILINIWISFTTPMINSNIHDEFVDALINGSFKLNIKPSEELLSLENPYDITQRQGIDYLWDVALYNDSYYVYFGILPFLILSVPIKLLTGSNLPTNLGVLIFSIFIIINLSGIIIAIFKKWFKNTKFNYLILALIGNLAGSLLFWISRRPYIYEFVLSAAVCFSTAGIYFMIKARGENDEVNYKYLFLAATCLALAVACRPNQLIISLIFVPTIIKLLINNFKQRKNIIKTICVVGIPYLIVGILLMLYNYIRFDNIFEFGASYQLTVNDMRNLSYRILTIPVGILTQIFKLPIYTNTFPFFIHQYETISFFGYYYVESLVCGLFILNPINFALFFLISIRKKVKQKEIYNITCILTGVSILMCIANIVLAGTLQRYSMDYAWILNIASYLTIFMITDNITNEVIKKYILKIVLVLTLFMLFANFIVGAVVSEHNLLEKFYPKQYYNIRYSICFWE